MKKLYFILILCLLIGCSKEPKKMNFLGTWYHIITKEGTHPSTNKKMTYYEYWEYCFDDAHIFGFSNESGSFPPIGYYAEKDSLFFTPYWETEPFVRNKILFWNPDKFQIANIKDTLTFYKIPPINKELKEYYFYIQDQKEWRNKNIDSYWKELKNRELEALKRHGIEPYEYEEIDPKELEELEKMFEEVPINQVNRE